MMEDIDQELAGVFVRVLIGEGHALSQRIGGLGILDPQQLPGLSVFGIELVGRVVHPLDEVDASSGQQEHGADAGPGGGAQAKHGCARELCPGREQERDVTAGADGKSKAARDIDLAFVGIAGEV